MKKLFTMLALTALPFLVQATAGITVYSPSNASFYTKPYIKLQEDQTQYIVMTFDTGNVFKENPDSHMWIMLDSRAKPDKFLQGRGIVIGDITPVAPCTEVAFEHFSNPNEHPGNCGFIGLADNTKYRIVVHVNHSWVVYWVYGEDGRLLASDSTYMPDYLYNEEISEVRVGLAFDKNPAYFRVLDINSGVF